jgi:glucose/arabinose dehydrogenase
MRSLLYVNLFVFTIIIFCLVLFSPSVIASNNEPKPKYDSQNDEHQKLKNKALDVPTPEKLKFDDKDEKSQSNFYSNPPFVFFDNQSGMINFGLGSFWKDQSLSCAKNFECVTDFSTGWNDTTSFRVSTTSNNVNHTRALFYGKSLEVTPQKQYQFVSHMKLNKWASQSQVVLEGFDQGTGQWDIIKECPSGVNGPIEWKEYNCYLIIPENTTKVRPVLNAGWSSKEGEDGVTWFDTIYLIKIDNPFIFNANLKAEVVFQGLDRPTSMEFLGPNDILVTEKRTGKLIEIKNGTASTLLDVKVANLAERGLLGVAITPKSIASEEDNNKPKLEKDNNQENNSNKDKYVFLYFTEAKSYDGEDKDGIEPIGNRLYRFELSDNSLQNPKLLLDLPAGYHHNGGKMLIGPDKDLYIVIGELDDKSTNQHKSNMALNKKNSSDPDGRGGILRINPDGDGIDGGIIGKNPPLNKYFAYGIRNSFGMDLDPLTGNLWDTENGPRFGDEINLVNPGFDSGWRKVQGMWNVEKGEIEGRRLSSSEKPSSLVYFGDKGQYSSPELTWNKTVGPTALKFVTTDKLGKEYENDLLVADVNGRVYHFDMNKNRTGLVLNGPLKNKVVESNDEINNLVFFEGFGRVITDLDIGPDGYLYVLDLAGGKIYRISSNINANIVNYLEQASKNRFNTN